MWGRTAFAASLAMGTALVAASAQESLVTVDLSNLHGQIAGNLDVEADEVPTTLRLPAEMAADVCGSSVSGLGGSCTATDMMWATHYAIREIEGDPFSTQDDNDDRPTEHSEALLDAPGSSTNTAGQHGP